MGKVLLMATTGYMLFRRSVEKQDALKLLVK